MVLKYPVTTEKAVGMIERQNTIVFVVDPRATKTEIKTEFERVFSVKVKAVNTLITMKGVKKAFIKLAEGFSADEIAARLKIT
ncbi:MAG: 50S ribosomal protein L23 [Candidatus Micrarchaeota archaeon]|nr:50S ribosomal protein L23 [Candidatus Micrarchaeota archaeon]